MDTDPNPFLGMPPEPSGDALAKLRYRAMRGTLVQRILEAAIGLIESGLPGVSIPQWENIALRDIGRAIEEVRPVWTRSKHRRLTQGRYSTAMDWLKAKGYKNPSFGQASSLCRRALQYNKKNTTECPYYGDGVVELLKSSRVVRYFNDRILEIVHDYKWTPKNALVAEAQVDLDCTHGPLQVPNFAKGGY